MKTLSLLFRNSIFQRLLAFGCWVFAIGSMVSLALFLVMPVFSTRPDSKSERYWEKKLYSGVLPVGYSDFRATLATAGYRCPYLQFSLPGGHGGRGRAERLGSSRGRLSALRAIHK